MTRNAQAPTLEDSARAVGVLRYVSEDALRYHFQSTDNPNVYHLVDLAEWECSGACSCEHFDIRIRPLLSRRVIEPHEERAKCKHIRRAEKILCYRVKRQLVAQSQNHPKKP